MKKLAIILPLVAIALFALGAAIRQTTAIYINNSTDDVQLKIRKAGGSQSNPWIEILDGNTMAFQLPASGVIPITYGGTGAATAKAARTALGLPENATNSVMPIANGGTAAATVAAARTNLGIQTISMTTSDDGTVTNTFGTMFTAAPTVLLSRQADTFGTNSWVVTKSNVVYTAGEPSITVVGVALGTY